MWIWLNLLGLRNRWVWRSQTTIWSHLRFDLRFNIVPYFKRNQVTKRPMNALRCACKKNCNENEHHFVSFSTRNLIWKEKLNSGTNCGLHGLKHNIVHSIDADGCGPPCIIVFNETDLVALDPLGGAFQPVVSGLFNAIAVDVHVTEGLLFWSDGFYEETRISRANIDGKSASTIINVRGECAGLAVEWMSNLLYWTDATNDVIEVAHLDGTDRRVLALGLDNPRCLVVDPRKG